jgi:hypothetical protein
MMNGLLIFLKNQVRSWISHMVELVGGRRLAPLFDTRRGIGSTFFTQEYEGRDCDISLIPWIRHRNFFSALLHCIYNPSEQEFRDWIEAAERETWRYIPAIKSHIAEEVTLDRCVQRLRKRVIVESWEKHHPEAAAQMTRGHPSFFQSPSLVNLGGLGVGDQTLIEAGAAPEPLTATDRPKAEVKLESLPPVEIGQGWGGMGLKGCHSRASLERSNSAASGLFFDEEAEESEDVTTQLPGEVSRVLDKKPSSFGTLNDEYLKTTSMAHFYYRKVGSQEDLLIRKSRSHSHLGEHKEEDAVTFQHHYERRKSKSNFELGKAMPPPSEDETADDEE